MRRSGPAPFRIRRRQTVGPRRSRSYGRTFGPWSDHNSWINEKAWESGCMTADFSEETSAHAVAASFDGAPDRLRTVLVSLVRHLHGFIRDVGLTQREWEAAVEFLTATGQR